jgi:glutamine synthetase
LPEDEKETSNKDVKSYYKAEYIWIDGTKPTAQIRSKTKILKKGQEPPIWGFDGSSTNQATGANSDCVLKPVKILDNPQSYSKDLKDKLVLCEVFTTDMKPHSSNTRAMLREVDAKYASHKALFGIEQEYTLFKDGRPLGFPKQGYPPEQGPYYCSVAAAGREIAEGHLDICLWAGLEISGINAEVMPGQWEFQVGPLSPIEVGDELWIARYLLEAQAAFYDTEVSLEGKPVDGDWNGAGAHANFSTKSMRTTYGACLDAVEALREASDLHIMHYGAGIEKRLTGLHETCSYKEFRHGVSDRGASIRIPWQVFKEGHGYIEDRRPNANCDPYVVARLMLETVCKAEVKKLEPASVTS